MLIQRVALAPAWIWVTLLTSLAFGLRLYHLGFESFWFDEADVVRLAQAPALDIITSFGLAGANGPLYILLLHFWMMVAGTGETAVRTISMVFGAAGVPAIYALGKRVLNRELGLLAALLLAFSPFHIWHSQDAKMYTMVVLLAIVSSLLYLLALEEDKPRWWVLFVVATWVSLFTHMFAALVLAGQLLATPFIWWAVGRAKMGDGSRWGQMRRPAIALLVMLAPILPLAIARAEALTVGNITAGWYPVGGFTDMLGATLVSLSVNRVPQPWELIGTLVLLALALIGAWPWISKRWPLERATQSMASSGRERSGAVFLIVMFVVPILMFGLLTLLVPLFEPRYLIIVLPFYLLLAAAGLLRLMRLTPLLGLLGVVLALIPAGAALAQVNYSPEPQKEEWRQAIAYIRDHVRPRDVLIVHPGYLKSAVEYYYHASGGPDVPIVPVVGVPDLQTENFGPREVDDWMMEQITDHERAWLITSPPRAEREDPEERVKWFFDGNSGKSGDWRMFDHPHEYIGVMIYAYAFNGQPRSWFPQPTVPQQIIYQDNFTFRGYIYELPSEPPVAQNASWLPLTLYWRFTAQPAADQNYEMLLQLLDEGGQERARWTGEPLSGYRRTSDFPIERDIIDYRDVWVGGDVPPGVYHLALTVYPVGQPDAPIKVASGENEGETTVVLREPITIEQWQPPAQ